MSLSSLHLRLSRCESELMRRSQSSGEGGLEERIEALKRRVAALWTEEVKGLDAKGKTDVMAMRKEGIGFEVFVEEIVSLSNYLNLK